MTAEEFTNLIKARSSEIGTKRRVDYRLGVKKKYHLHPLSYLLNDMFPRIENQKWIDKANAGNLKVNGKQVLFDAIVKEGDIITHFNEEVEPKVNNNIRLIYSDSNLVVLDKPAPLTVHPSGRFFHNSLTEILKRTFESEKFYLVHRLDANTTGVLVLAKNIETANTLKDLFQNGKVDKEYLALVEGVVDQEEFQIKSSFDLAKGVSGSRNIAKTGLVAITEVVTLARDEVKQQSLLSVKPITGRTNQIRVHLANMGYPIVGDYGYKDPRYFEKNPLTYPTDCLCLHSKKITFELKGEVLAFESATPKKLML